MLMKLVVSVIVVLCAVESGREFIKMAFRSPVLLRGLLEMVFTGLIPFSALRICFMFSRKVVDGSN